MYLHVLTNEYLLRMSMQLSLYLRIGKNLPIQNALKLLLLLTLCNTLHEELNSCTFYNTIPSKARLNN